MKSRYLLLSLALCALTLAATAWLFPSLPARIPLHWNVHGEIDRHGGRAAIFLLPALMAGLTGLLALLPRLSPRQFAVGSFSDTYGFCMLALAAMLAYVQALMLWGALNGGIDLPRLLMSGVALFQVALGNVMGKVRRNFWLGVRTPWTLASPRVWYATHRLAAKSMVASGLLALLALQGGLHRLVPVALLLAGALLPVGYSLLHYQRLARAGRLDD